jgi:hypothetical protein
MNWGNFDTSKLISHPKKCWKNLILQSYSKIVKIHLHTHTHTYNHIILFEPIFFVVSFCFEFHEIFQNKIFEWEIFIFSIFRYYVFRIIRGRVSTYEILAFADIKAEKTTKFCWGWKYFVYRKCVCVEIYLKSWFFYFLARRYSKYILARIYSHTHRDIDLV